MIYELIPTNGRKSFYGKAIIEETETGKTLYSYGTKIARITTAGITERLWDGWTATTGNHIKSFCGMNKAQFTAIPYTGPAHDPGGRTLTNAESYRAMMARRNSR